MPQALLIGRQAMTAPQTPADDTAAEVPVACSLTRAGLAEQAGRWERLAARAMTAHEQTADGVRISFRPDPGTEKELRSLVAVETECCAWAGWTVQASASRLVLDVRATGDGIAALHGMFTGMRQAPVPR
jgi:hypothetical protein